MAAAPVGTAERAAREGDPSIPMEHEFEVQRTTPGSELRGDEGPSDHDQAGADRNRTSADSSQTSADRDQTSADRDQTSAERDQVASNSDQRAADEDQVASDRDHAGSLGREVHARTRETREQNRSARTTTAHGRHDTALERDTIARERDLAAAERDRVAAERDREADARDAEIARLAASWSAESPRSDAQIVLRATRDRQRAAADRQRAAAHRAQAARDREQAARDRQQAAEDRAHATSEREAAEIDVLTGALRRGPGLAELQREMDRARRADVRFVVAYIDVDGLKLTNDSRGHSAGDAVLKRVVEALQARLRSYEPIIRLGGDEFLCALSGTTIERARQRFEEIDSELAAIPYGGSITAGFAELLPGDSPAALINRADRDLLTARGPRRS